MRERASQPAIRKSRVGALFVLGRPRNPAPRPRACSLSRSGTAASYQNQVIIGRLCADRLDSVQDGRRHVWDRHLSPFQRTSVKFRASDEPFGRLPRGDLPEPAKGRASARHWRTLDSARRPPCLLRLHLRIVATCNGKQRCRSKSKTARGHSDLCDTPSVRR